MTKPKTKMEWMAEKSRLQAAGREADTVVEQLKLASPINPLVVIESEWPLLRAGGRNFSDRFDGKLEYHREKNRFLLFFNTKYDTSLTQGEHHPRTRFSVCHELGHYFLDRHRAYLMRTATSHLSKGEFASDFLFERESDSFAASMLLPTRFVRPIVNKAELSVERVRDIAQQFNASLVSSILRSVALSDFPCAVAGIRNDEVAWMFPSEPLIEAGIYPNKGFLPRTARKAWTAFQFGASDQSSEEGQVDNWFNVYGRDDFSSVYVREEYVPVPSMGTLLVLLTIDESDLHEDDEERDSGP